MNISGQMTLAQHLARIGWSHGPSANDKHVGKRAIYNETGAHVGNYDFWDAWLLLQFKGYLPLTFCGQIAVDNRNRRYAPLKRKG